MALKPAATCLLVAALLLFTVQPFASPGFAQSSASQSILRNGDFSNGLTGWTPGILRSSGFGGYPRWGIFNSTPWRTGLNPFAFLDVPGGSAAYLDSDPFMLPNKPGGWTLDFTLWGLLSPTILEVQIKTQTSIYTLDSFEPPKVELGQQPVMKHYSIPSNFTGQNIAVRFTCSDTPPYHAQGVYCGFDDIVVAPAQSGPIATTTSVQMQIFPPSANAGAAPGLFAFVFIGLGLALGAAGAGIALAFRQSGSALYSCPICGARYQPGWPSCTRCGAQLYRWSRCGRCGGYVSSLARFCHRCGLSFHYHWDFFNS